MSRDDGRSEDQIEMGSDGSLGWWISVGVTFKHDEVTELVGELSAWLGRERRREACRRSQPVPFCDTH